MDYIYAYLGLFFSLTNYSFSFHSISFCTIGNKIEMSMCWLDEIFQLSHSLGILTYATFSICRDLTDV